MEDFKLETYTFRDIRIDFLKRSLYPLRLAEGRKNMNKTYDGYINSKGVAYLYCLFHKEKNPSLCIHKNNSVYCYGCGRQTTLNEIKEQL